jgi:hypothetical protein
VDRWFLRDANWSPDWPSAAKSAEAFYWDEMAILKEIRQKEKKGDPVLDSAPASGFTSIIGLTPKFITDLLEITGPVTVENTVYDQANFTKLLEYKVEKGYTELGVPAWQRKEVIGEIAKEIKIKLLDLPGERWLDFSSVLLADAAEKNIIIYSKDEARQKIITAAGYGGQIADPPGDYLMIADANLAALKTDAVVAKTVEYRLEETPDGLFADVRLTYAHHGGFDWRTTRYRTYTRLYAPKGSKLISLEGQSEGEAEYTEEANKSVWGAFLSVEPGEIGELKFRYRLPETLVKEIKTGNYRLLLQKQPGSRIDNLRLHLEFMNKISDFEPASLYANMTTPTSLDWQGDFLSDTKFLVVFDQ